MLTLNSIFRLIPIFGIFVENSVRMAKNTSILLGTHFENFITEKVSSGKFNSASEVIRTALRLLELEEQKTKHLRNELELGENSKMNKSFNPKSHLANLRKKHL